MILIRQIFSSKYKTWRTPESESVIQKRCPHNELHVQVAPSDVQRNL